MPDAVLFNAWFVAVFWAALYMFDYASTLWLARVYRTTLSQHIIYERGVELNPNFEMEIARQQLLSPKFIALLSLVFAIVLLIGLLGRFFVELVAGLLLLTWFFIDSRHLRNYFFLWFLRQQPESLKGRLEYSYWLMQKTLASEAVVFSLLYVILALLTWRFFFLAGALGCLSVAVRHYRLAHRKPPGPMHTEPES